MRTYILTDSERELIKAYLAEGTTSSQLRTIKGRAKESHDQLTRDLRLVYRFLMDMGIYVSDEYTPLEVLEERRLDEEATRE